MKIARIVFDVDMRCNFEGIREILKKSKIDLDTISSDYVVFLLNSRQTSFKVLIDNTYIVYYKSARGRIPLDAIQYLPQRFGGSEMEFNRAVEKSLKVKLHIPDAPEPHAKKTILRKNTEARA